MTTLLSIRWSESKWLMNKTMNKTMINRKRSLCMLKGMIIFYNKQTSVPVMCGTITSRTVVRKNMCLQEIWHMRAYGLFGWHDSLLLID